MAWRVVWQPDRRFAIFSEVVDDFTHLDMTEDEVLEVCAERVGRLEAIRKVARAKDSPERWAEAQRIIASRTGC